jgi:hypothetical protein
VSLVLLYLVFLKCGNPPCCCDLNEWCCVPTMACGGWVIAVVGLWVGRQRGQRGRRDWCLSMGRHRPTTVCQLTWQGQGPVGLLRLARREGSHMYAWRCADGRRLCEVHPHLMHDPSPGAFAASAALVSWCAEWLRAPQLQQHAPAAAVVAAGH